MSRRSKETLAVQLFPFLAVLVCTMGSLIFLLLVTTREIRQRAVAYAAYQLAQAQLAADDVPTLPVLSIPAVQPLAEEPKPSAEEDDGYEAALAERERELSELKASWRDKANLLSKKRDYQLNVLARMKIELDEAEKKALSMQSEVTQLEVELGRLAGEAAVPPNSTSEAEQQLIAQQIAALRIRLKAAKAAEATANSDQFQVIPFDPQTGTSRRPIFIECTAAGIRFLPEDILITAKDLEGFTHKANPLAAGTGALINYWSVWNLKQRQPHAEPEPYVLLLVRPDGVYAYYVALKMLEPIRTSHGYELIEESTALKLPEVDPGAKMACQTAVNRLLAERENIYRTAVSSGSAGSVFGGGPGRRGSGLGKSFGAEPGNGSSASGDSGREGNTFTLSDITGGENAVGTRSWERVENFQGRPRGHRQNDTGSLTGMGNGERGTDRADSGTSAGAKGNSDPNLDESTAMQNGERSPSKRKPTGTSSGGGGQFDALPSEYDEGEPGMPIGQRPGHKPGSAGSTSDPEEGQVASDEESDAEGDGTGSSRSRPGNSANSSRLSDNSSSSRRFSHDPRNSTRAARPGERPSKNNDASDKPLEPEMLAGRRWGYCEQGASIGFEREVRVDVSADKLVVAEKHVIPVGQGESKSETLERFAMALDMCSREWGRPPQGFFWAPKLKFVVKPEGNGHYEQVNAMMTRAGLATSHEFSKAAKPVEFGRTAPVPAKPVPKTAGAKRSGGFQ
jgi:hypothetical protein